MKASLGCHVRALERLIRMPEMGSAGHTMACTCMGKTLAQAHLDCVTDARGAASRHLAGDDVPQIIHSTCVLRPQALHLLLELPQLLRAPQPPLLGLCMRHLHRPGQPGCSSAWSAAETGTSGQWRRTPGSLLLRSSSGGPGTCCSCSSSCVRWRLVAVIVLRKVCAADAMQPAWCWVRCMWSCGPEQRLSISLWIKGTAYSGPRVTPTC